MSSRLEGLGCSYYDKMGEGLERPGEAWRGGWRGLERPGEGAGLWSGS